MKLIYIFGPQAVGKMTVGQELCRLTGLKLFHNHMTIDVIYDIFDAYPQERRRLTDLFRHEIFDAFSKTDEYGMVFTFCWAFNDPADWEYVAGVSDMFKSRGADIYYVELKAERDERARRNHTENRLLHKPSKRDLEKSDMLFTVLEQEYRLNSLPDELASLGDNYMCLDNTDISAEDAAKIIRDKWNL